MPGRGPPEPTFDSRPPSPYNTVSLPGLSERCWSGRTGLPAKQLSGVNPDRGFESLPLRHRFLPFVFPSAPDRPGGCTQLPGCARLPSPEAARRTDSGEGEDEMLKAINPATGER